MLQCLTQANPLLVKRLAVSPERDHHKVVAFKRYTYEGLIARAEQEIQWADKGLALIDTLNSQQ